MSSTSEPLALPAEKAGLSRDAKVIALIAIAHFVSHVHIMLLPPILGQVRESFGVSYTQIALAITAFNIASALLQTPAGFLVDRVGPRVMLTGGLIVGSIAIAAAALLQGYWFFIIAYALMGVANTVYHPADYSILSATIDGKKIGKAFSIHTFAGYLGSGVTPAMVLACAAIWDWRGAFLFAAGLTFAVAMLLIVAGSVLPRVVRKPMEPSKADAVLLLPRHGQWRHHDLHRGRHGCDPRHAGLGRQRGAVGLPAVQRRGRAAGRRHRRPHAAP